MDSPATILVYGPAEQCQPLLEELGSSAQWVSDPYELLERLGRRPGSVLVALAGEDLPQVAQAARRLEAASVLAVAGVACEPQLRAMPEGLLDDYFIYPLNAGDIDSIKAAAGKPAAAAPPGRYVADAPASRGEPAAPLAPRDIAALVRQATGTAALEEALAHMVRERLGCQGRWVDSAVVASADAVLLEMPAAGRTLVSQSAPGAAAAGLETLQQCLPALLENSQRIESLHRLAITDHLTGAYNRRYFYHLTDNILLRARQKGFRVTLLLFDIDDFKQYNQQYGHAGGDEILREIAMLMKRTSRSHDVVARIGGDEFAILFWDNEPPRSSDSKPLEEAVALADRFRQAVSNHLFPNLGPEAQGRLTISGGLASFPSGGDTCRQLLRTADQALRAAKRSGKNAIHLIGKE